MALPVSPILAWFLAGIFFFVIELIAPGFIVFFFGIGAWCVALTIWLVDLNLSAQLILFLVCSLVSLLLLRTWFKSLFMGTTEEEEDSVNVVPDSATGVVVNSIKPPASGKVKYGGSFWTAVADVAIDEGTVVDIVEQNNLQVRVHPVKSREED
jgi:membrane protein implicated in regulation of membrane protease activity